MSLIHRLALTLTALGAVTFGSCSRGPSTTTISVVGTNDLHGGILARNGQGGLALLGGYLANLRAARAKDGGAVVLLDAGDMFQGTLESNLTEGAPVIDAYNALGYNAVAIGNHDFDYGPEGDQATPINPDEDPRGALKARAAQARFPFLAANILDTGTNAPVDDWPNVKPSALLDINGIKVGVVGLTTSRTLQTTISMNTYGLAIGPLAPALANEAARLRTAGATVIVGVAHAGGSCDAFESPTNLSSCEERQEIFEVARAVPPGSVDVIVAGHRHERIAHEVAGIAIIESRSNGRAFGRVDLTIDRKTGRVQSHRIFPPHEICAREDQAGACVDDGTAGAVTRRYEGLSVSPAVEIDAALAPAVQGAKARKEMPLHVNVQTALERFGDPPSPLGEWLVDLMVKRFGPADVAIHNTGGLRADIPAGPLTYGRLYEVFPFDNRVARLMVTGEELRQIVQGNLTRRGGLLLGGARALASCKGSILDIRLQRDNGTPIKPTDQLRVVTVDFLATGGDGFFDPIQPVKLMASVNDGPIFRDVLAFNLMRDGGTLKPLPSPRTPRGVSFAGPRPATCPASTQ